MTKPYPLRGKVVVMTGTLSVSREQFAILIEDAGGVAATSLSRSVDILIAGADPGDAKLTKANEYGIPIWTEAKARAIMEGLAPGLSTVKVYGASDDLVELTGAVDEELSGGGSDSTFIRFTNGTYVKLGYTNEGLWRATVLNTGRAKVRKLYGMPDDGDVTPQHHGDSDAPSYSDVLIIDSEEPFQLESWGRGPLPEPSRGLPKAKEVFKALGEFAGFEFFVGELDRDDYNAAVDAVAKVIDGAVAKAMDDWMKS